MPTDYGSWTFAADAASPPKEPRLAAELSALWPTVEASRDFVLAISRGDQTFSSLLAIADFIEEPAFDFLRQRFIVLDERAMRSAANAIVRVLERARATPDDMRTPFMVTYIDGTRHHSYEAGEVIDALDAAVVKQGDDSIVSEEAMSLWDVFTYLKSLRSLLAAALADRRAVVFLRVNELYESFPRSY